MKTDENYKLLCAAIVFEQCIEYDEAYRSYLKSPYRKQEWRKRRPKELRENLVRGFGAYLDIDMEKIAKEIEIKAQKGEQIIWKKRAML